MRLPIKPLCEQKRVPSDGTATIFLQYCYNADHKTFLSTGIAVPPGFWNRQQLCVKETLPAQYGDPIFSIYRNEELGSFFYLSIIIWE